MKQYKLVNNLVGWVTFVIAAITYCMTIEPTASFWDCPEFITTGYKLEVGHPPGAPFFMLTANLFSQFTSDPDGKHHECPDECGVYLIPVLEYHTPRKKTGMPRR